MRVFIIILVLIFSFQSFTNADDISEFEIEGMSIGDSLLNYFSEEKIKKEEKNAYIWKTKFLIIGFNDAKFKTYEKVQFAYKKNDKKYIIHGLDGIIKYHNNIKECYKKKKDIVSEISNIFTSAKIHNHKGPHQADKSNNSISEVTEYWFAEGDLARVICNDFSTEFENKRWYDELSVVLNSKEYANFLMNEAYK